jgi:hypothetical protein
VGAAARVVTGPGPGPAFYQQIAVIIIQIFWKILTWQKRCLWSKVTTVGPLESPKDRFPHSCRGCPRSLYVFFTITCMYSLEKYVFMSLCKKRPGPGRARAWLIIFNYGPGPGLTTTGPGRARASKSGPVTTLAAAPITLATFLNHVVIINHQCIISYSCCDLHMYMKICVLFEYFFLLF